MFIRSAESDRSRIVNFWKTTPCKVVLGCASCAPRQGEIGFAFQIVRFAYFILSESLLPSAPNTAWPFRVEMTSRSPHCPVPLPTLRVTLRGAQLIGGPVWLPSDPDILIPSSHHSTKWDKSTGRGADYSTPPPQIPACSFLHRALVEGQTRSWVWTPPIRRLAASVSC